MRNKRLLLLRMLLTSSSGINTIKHSPDPKKRNRVIGGYVGFGILYLMLILYSGFAAFGLGASGMGDSISLLATAILTILCLFFTILKVNGNLFNFKGYEMLITMPFSVKTIVADKFLVMYIKSLPWVLSISVATLIGYALSCGATIVTAVLWIVLSFIVPIIPMLIATVLGVVIAKLGSGFKHKKLMQTILTFVLVLPCFFIQYIVQHFVENKNALNNMLDGLQNSLNNIAGIYLPMKWFEQGVMDQDILSILLLVVVSVVLFELCFFITGQYYRQINSALQTSEGHAKVKENSVKKHSIVKSVAYKELKKFLGSTNYSVNCGMGQILIVILGIVSLVVGMDKVVLVITKGAPLDANIIIPGIPFLVHLIVNMVPTTCCSPSLEGKNYWIIQSLPIDKLNLYQGKILFNLFISIPFAIFGVVCMEISAKAGLTDTLISVLLVTVLCFWATCSGLIRGIKYIRLDWENDIEVIKQGAAVPLYLFPNLIVTIILMVAIIFLGTYINVRPVLLGITVVVVIMTALSYLKIVKLAKKNI